MTNISKDLAIKELWRLGELSFKLHSMQREIQDAVRLSTSPRFVINCSRQSGKSYLLCVMAIEFALKHPGSKICYVAPTAKMVKKIINARIKSILQDCPRELKPHYRVNDQIYLFKNGSEIHISGTESGRAENIRGQVFHFIIVDEAGFITDLDYIVQSILMPTTLTTSGTMILSSTPPTSPDHDFIEYLKQAERDGNYIKKTIYDNPMITEKHLEQYKKDCGGEDSIAWRREYLCEILIDETEAVIPEATEERMKSIVKEHQRPPFFDAYTVIDLGYTDNTGILFAYYDFYQAKIIIEDEAVFNKPTSQLIAEIIALKEANLWNGKPVFRYCDGDLITISDLNSKHNLKITPVRNDELEASVNEVRNLVRAEKIVINPKCVNLASQVRYATWNKARNGFVRTKNHGHYDLLASLIYLVRNIKRFKNPTPAGHGVNIENQFVPVDMTRTKVDKEISKIFSGIDKFFKKDP